MADCVEKVLFGRRPKFFRTADAFHARRREGPHQFAQTQPRTVLLVLKSRATAERPNNRPSRDFRSRSIFDFFNSIGPARTFTLFASNAPRSVVRFDRLPARRPMRRRDFVKFVGGTAAASTLPSFAARGQLAERPVVALVV
jgi:hypothetical protein